MSSTSSSDSPSVAERGLPRGVDLIVALVGLLVASPLLAVIAVAVKLSSPGPILFRQERVGKDGERFRLLKFRSMRAGSVGPEITASGDARITAVGRVLRRLKLDELPALWNVVRGEMALVGPRPEVPRFVDLADPRWRVALSLKPGLTDPVTVELRSEETLLAEAEDPESFYSRVLQPYKLRAYERYLRQRSPATDARILWATFLAILIPSRTPAPTVEEIRERVGTASEQTRNPLSPSPD